MSTHPWFDLVIGGVSVPRILSVGDNLCANPRFNVDTTGWIFGAGLNVSNRVVDSKAYTEYMGSLVHLDDANTYTPVERSAFYNVDYGSSILGKKFLISFRVHGNVDGWDGAKLRVYMGEYQVGYEYLDGYAGEANKIGELDKFAIQSMIKTRRCAVVTSAVDVDVNIIGVQFSGSETGAAGLKDLDNEIYIDDIYICEVLEDYEFVQPQSTHVLFNKFTDGSLQLFDGKVKEFNKRWLPNYIAAFGFLDSDNESYRQAIAEAENLFVFPHNDFNWGFFAKWDNDFKRAYPWERFFGHVGDIVLKGDEYLIETLHPLYTAEVYGYGENYGGEYGQ